MDDKWLVGNGYKYTAAIYNYTQLLYNAIHPIHKPYTPVLPYSQASCLFRQTTSSPCEAGRGWRRLDRSLRVKERLISFSDDIQEFFEGRLYVAKYIGGGVLCECIRITDGRPPRCFQNKYSIPNVLSHQHSWARKQKYSF